MNHLEGKLRVNYRPLKVAYFIPEKDAASLKRVMLLCCTQWGGIRNFIIPVGEGGELLPLFTSLLTIHPPDLFVSYLPESVKSGRSGLEERLAAIFRERAIRIRLGDRYENYDESAHALSVIPDLASAGVTPTSFLGPDGTLIVHKFTGLDEHRLALLAVFGSIYPGQEEHYARVLRPCERLIDFHSPGHWSAQHTNSLGGSAINLTAHGVSLFQSQGGFPGDIAFNVVVTDSVRGLCVYWTFRAIRESSAFKNDGRRTLLLPRALVKSCLEGLVEFVRSCPAAPEASSNLDIAFSPDEKADRAAIEEAMRAIGNTAVLRGARELSLWSGHTDRQPREADPGRTIQYAFTSPHLPASYLEGVRPFSLPEKLSLTVGPNEIRADPPAGFHNRDRGAVAIDLHGDLWARYPKDQAVCDLVWANAWPSPYGLTASMKVVDRPELLSINIPSEWDALRACFRRRGYDARHSPNGRYGLALMELVGGLARMSAIASVPAYRLLDGLALKSSVKVAQKLKAALSNVTIGDEELAKLLADADVIPELKRVPRSLKQLKSTLSIPTKDLLELLSRLSKLELVRRGFHARCPNCETPTWYPLHGLGERLTCPGCFATFPLPVEYPDGSGAELGWEYTLNGLVNRVMDQDVLPHVLALHHLTKEAQAFATTPGVELCPTGQRDAAAEFDFLYVADSNLKGGECKAGTELGDKDIAAARVADGLGFSEFSFCTIREFSPDTIARVESLKVELAAKKSSMAVRVLSGKELLGGVLP
jgi:hypothetical protein